MYHTTARPIDRSASRRVSRVASATVRRGLGHGLDEVATRIAMQIRFRPARDRTGKPIAGTVRWRFHFQAP